MSQIEPKHIAIAGNIGSGKTSLAELLSKYYGWDLKVESVEDNPYLRDFYQDMNRWAFPLQIYFLHSRFKQLIEIRHRTQTVIQDRTIYEDAYIFTRNLFESQIMNERDYQTYSEVFDTMHSMIGAPDLLIYLRGNIGLLIDRIAQRGRDYESKISIRYLENLNQRYEKWISTYTDSELMIIEIEKYDFVNNPNDMGRILHKIHAELFGLF